MRGRRRRRRDLKPSARAPKDVSPARERGGGRGGARGEVELEFRQVAHGARHELDLGLVAIVVALVIALFVVGGLGPVMVTNPLCPLIHRVPRHVALLDAVGAVVGTPVSARRTFELGCLCTPPFLMRLMGVPQLGLAHDAIDVDERDEHRMGEVDVERLVCS